MTRHNCGDTHAVSFKLPQATWQEIHDIAYAHGVDITAVLNWLVAEGVPKLLMAEAVRRHDLATARQALRDEEAA